MSGLFLAIAIPRLLIPIVASEQEVELSSRCIQDIIYFLSLWKRDINLFYVCFAYFFPSIILYRPARLKTVQHELGMKKWKFLLLYAIFVFSLILVGGTDMERFASYFFLPMAVLFGCLAKKQPLVRVIAALSLQFIFNRIWLPFPTWDYDLFASFYGGWSVVIDTRTIWRYIEVITYAVVGNIATHFKNSLDQNGHKPANKERETE